jgi:hypothetical protein
MRKGLPPKKAVIRILLLLLFGAFLSCTTTPPAWHDPEPPVESAETGLEDPGGVPGSGGEAPEEAESGGLPGEAPSGGDSAGGDQSLPSLSIDEIPDVNPPLPEEEPDEAAGELAEPFADLPETTDAPLPPGEAPGPGLEEPDAPALSEAPETLQNAAEAPPDSAAPPSGDPPPPAPPQAPPPPEPDRQPPAPPPFLGPPEEEVPPRQREPVPAPENPVPELPARTPVPAVPEGIVFSRVVRATVGQLAEIPFRGAGWVYLGELSSRRGLAYDSRRLDSEGQSFVFRCEAVGTYVLKFYRQDFIRDYILNDYVQVIVGEAPESSGIGLFNPPAEKGRVIAEPRWPPLEREREELSREPGPGTPAEHEETAGARTPPPETAALEGGAPDRASPPGETAAGGTLPGAVPGSAQDTETAPDTDEDTQPDEYVRRALEEYNAGRIAQALAIMERFRQHFPEGTDEAWWLLGQLLEANSPARDIALALEYYRRLVREFPQSQRVEAARRRIAYLERFYFNIQ